MANILLSSAGRRVSLLRLLKKAIVARDKDARIVAADLRPDMSAACHVADDAFAVPRISDPQFIPALLDICKREKITAIVPTIDTELEILARHRDVFARSGVTAVVSASETIALARDKQKFVDHLLANNLPAPRTWRPAEFPRQWSERRKFIAKPVGGSSSIGLVYFDSLDIPAEFAADAMIQEVVEGKEYTVNTYVDRAGTALGFAPHERIETRGGEVSKARIVRNARLEQACAAVVHSLPGAWGPMCLQAIDGPDGPKFIELNARFCGGFPLACRAGLASTDYLAAELAGEKPRPVEVRDGVLMLRYDDEVFVEK